MAELDFAGLAARLLASAETLLPAWLPAGRRSGHEFVCGNLAGEPGKSLSVNLTTGVWADFAADTKGGDLVSLYAAIHGMTQAQAYHQLGGEVPRGTSKTETIAAHKAPRTVTAVKPNGATQGFTGIHPKHGLPAHLYAYRDIDGEILFFVARYHTEAGKTFAPWIYDGSRWIARAYPAPRPLYGLELLAAAPLLPVLVVEGEKTADAARALISPARQLVVTWCGGAQAFQHADWTPLTDRRVTIWPDADSAGRRAAAGIASLLLPLAATVSVIDPTDRPEGWDLGDAEPGTPFADLIRYAKPRTKLLQRPSQQPAVTVPAAPQPASPAAEGDTALHFRSQSQAWEYFGLDTTNGGKPHANADTVSRVLAKHPIGMVLWYDAFRGVVMRRETATTSRPWNDADSDLLLVMLQRDIFLPRVTEAHMEPAINLVARATTVHPVKSWLESLPPWDGDERCEDLFCSGFGAEPSDYHRAASLAFLISMVARVYDPGCLVRLMPVLEGAQWTGKSTGLRALAHPWYFECLSRLDSKDFYQDIQGYWLIELSELSSLLRASVEAVKGCISRRDDVYRASYGRRSEPHLRQCVFAGTTNSNDWQIDDTGGTRFLPIATGAVNMDWLIAQRDQLFAEALHRYRAGQSWHEVPADIAQLEQERRHIGDAWYDDIERYTALLSRVTVREIMIALELDITNRRNAESYRICRILSQLGFVRARTGRERYYMRSVCAR